MKTRLKHLSKSTISIILAVLMVVSTLAVGIVATTAARIDSDLVGYNTMYLSGTFNNWAEWNYYDSSDNEYKWTLSSLNANSTYQFVIRAENSDYFKNATLSASAQSQANTSKNSGSNCTLNTISADSGKVNVNFYFKPHDNNENGTIYYTQTAVPSSDRYIHWSGSSSNPSDFNNHSKMTKSGDSYSITFNPGGDCYLLVNGSSSSPTATDSLNSTTSVTYSGNYTWKNDGIQNYNIGSTTYYLLKFSVNANVTVVYNSSSNSVTVTAVSTDRTVTYGVCTDTGQSAMGTVTATSGGTSIGSSPATVANGTSVTFTATPNFGYEFEGWYTNAACTTEKSTSNPLEVTASSNITRYAKFQIATQDTNNPYYLGGRMTVATSSANIHSSTIAKDGVEQYGVTLNEGAGLDKSTRTGGSNNGASTNYWTFVPDSTNLQFSLKDGSSTEVGHREYILNTYRTVKQLSEDKDNMYAEYGTGKETAQYTGRDVYHDPFLFLVHDKRHYLTGSGSSGNAFHNNLETNKFTLGVNTRSGGPIDSDDLRFNNFNSQSNGWVRIHLEESGYDPTTGLGNPLIWYEIVDETPPAAETVRISATPARVDRNKTGDNVTLKGSYVGTSNASAESITYTFYKSTDGKTWGAPIRAASTSDTYSYHEDSTASTMYYKVVVGSNVTHSSGLQYDTRSAVTSVEIYASGLYMSSHISGTANPSWGDDLTSYASSNTPYQRTTSSTYTNSNPYVFSLSTIKGWDPDFDKYTIDEASNQFCTIEYAIKDVTIDEESASVVTYKVIPNPQCNNPTVYVDFKNKKIWAIATWNKSSNYKKKTSDFGTETVTYYFAERVADMSKSNPNGITYSNNEGMRIHYWNNSNPNGLNGDANITTKIEVAGKNSSGTATTTNSIWVDTSALYHKDNALSGKTEFKVYSVKLPIWATSFQFRTGDNKTFNAVPTTTNETYIADHSITLNPNRIYCLFNNDTGDNWRVKGVVLDESMWDYSRSTSANEVKTYKVDTNVINYTDNNQLENPDIPSWALSSAYSAYQTPWALYFGYFSTSNTTINSTQGTLTNDYDKWGSALYNLGKANKQQWAANLAQRGDNNHSYYAAVQDLVGMTTSKTKFNTNGDGATFGYLLDTKGNDATTGKSTAGIDPVFAYAKNDTGNALSSYSSSTGGQHSATATIAQGKKFPFYESNLNGITTYSYDSTTDRNRTYTNGNFSIQNSFATGTDSDGKHYTGLFPFGGNTNKYSNCGFGLEFDLNFYMSNTGYLTDKDGNNQDIAFNFSGDDDVWVYVDGVKVLDLGGTHKVSAATINFTDRKVYYKSSANSIDNVTGVKDTWAYDNNNYINVIDFAELMAAYGKPFNSTDASTKHTFQMFYLERGSFQSNCVISFNLPQAAGLNIKNNITVDNVNPVLQQDTLYVTNPDYFTYQVSARLASDLPQAISDIAKAPATATGTLELNKPNYPYGYETKRVFNDGTNPVVTYLLSKQLEQPGTVTSSLTYNSNAWTPLTNTVYGLSDEYIQSTTEGYAHVTGITDNTAAADFHLLGAQMATFENKITNNAYVKVAQTHGLGVVQENGTDPITYKTVTNNETGNYYITSYSVFDEKSKKYIVDKTPIGIDINHSHYAKDTRLNGTTGQDGFYFSNYTGDAEDINSAMRVDFYNDVAVGTIRIEKELNEPSYSDAKFKFKLKLGRLFGSGSETLKEYPGLEYKLYNSDGTLIGTRWYNATNGIVLTPGQYAEVEGVPVETYYEVEETPAAAYSFTSMTKTAVKPNGDTIYYNNTADTANEYSETVLAPSAPKSTKTAITTEGTGDDAFVIYKNMIPPVKETLVSSTNNYVSLNKLLFINQREEFTITFKYYDRDLTNNVPASISNTISTYSSTLKNLEEYIYNKDDPATGYEYLSTLPGIDGIETGDFVAYNYEKMIKAKAVEFVENTGTGVSNLIDNYRMWTRQSKAVANVGGLPSITNLKTGSKYSGDDIQYHTTKDGQLNSSGERWVNYYSSDGHELFPENPANAEADFHAGDLSKYENIKSIVVWLYNEPKAYTVNVYGAKDATDLNAAQNITLKGKNITVTGARVAKKVTKSGDATTQDDKGYYNLKGYYSQRLGRVMGDNYLDDIAYLKVYDVDSCVNIGTKAAPERVLPNKKAPETITDGSTTLQFAYWAYDEAGTQVATTDYRYGYRITGDFDLYAVYAPAKLDKSAGQFGLTIVEDANDTFVDSSGKARVRINTMFNPYNLPDNDVNIKRAAVVNIYVSKLIRGSYNYTEVQIKNLMAQYDSQLKAMLVANSFSPINTSLNVQLTTKGYVKLVNSGSTSINLTNKNRIEFTTQFDKDQLYVDAEHPVAILQVGAMAYDFDENSAIESSEWVLSDNSIYRRFSVTD